MQQAAGSSGLFPRPCLPTLVPVLHFRPWYRPGGQGLGTPAAAAPASPSRSVPLPRIPTKPTPIPTILGPSSNTLDHPSQSSTPSCPPCLGTRPLKTDRHCYKLSRSSYLSRPWYSRCLTCKVSVGPCFLFSCRNTRGSAGKPDCSPPGHSKARGLLQPVISCVYLDAKVYQSSKNGAEGKTAEYPQLRGPLTHGKVLAIPTQAHGQRRQASS